MSLKEAVVLVEGNAPPARPAKNAMQLDVYLTFDGTCREAFEFYREAFGGQFNAVLTFAEGPDDTPVDEQFRDRIMHVSLSIGANVLMGSDWVPGFGAPRVRGNNFAISISPASREEADALFAKLSEGGTVEMPMQDMFWGAYFGSFSDRYEVNWQINCPHQEGRGGRAPSRPPGWSAGTSW